MNESTEAKVSPKRAESPTVEAFQNQVSFLDRLESEVTTLLNRLEPVLGPDLRDKSLEDGGARSESSEVVYMINAATDRLDTILTRIRAANYRLEL